MSNSGLVKYSRLSPNRNSPRNHVIDGLAIHCYVGQASVEDMGSWFAQSAAQASSNYGIGADGRVGLYVPESDRAWTTSSRTVDNRCVTIECACDKTAPNAVNDKVYASLIELCTDICKRNGIKKLIWSNNKDDRINYRNGCNMQVHRDYAAKSCPGDFLYARMGQIASEVNTRLGSADPTVMYRVRLSWDNPASQTGAYEVLQNAIDDANNHPGYSVFDQTEKAVYTSPDAISGPADTTVAKGIPSSKDDYIAKVAAIAVDLYKTTKILPSVIIGQACLENGFGLGSDAIELTKRNNLFGLKADLLNPSWASFSVWNGDIYRKLTPEYKNGKMVQVYDNFRVYKDYRQCITDYEQFLLNVQNSKGYKYRRIAGWTDPAKVINAIRIGTGTNTNPEGYATDPDYETKVLKCIKENNLTRFDKQAGVKEGETPVATDQWYRAAQSYKNGKYVGQVGAYEKKEGAISKAKEKGICAFDPNGNQIYPDPKNDIVDRYVVRRRFSEEKYQLGAFHDLKNAKKQAKANWGYRVYDLLNPDKAIYKPQLTRPQKLCAAFVRLNQWLVDDIAAGKDWRYFNTGHVSESTFWLTRKANKLYTNCMGGVSFALKESGIPAKACSWYGAKGFIRFLNDHAEADLRKYADIIPINGKKTPKQLVADGTLCPGDILTFMTFNHTCGYLGNGISYDSGHAFCLEKGEGARYVKWIGPLSWENYKVGFIIRLKP